MTRLSTTPVWRGRGRRRRQRIWGQRRGGRWGRRLKRGDTTAQTRAGPRSRVCPLWRWACGRRRWRASGGRAGPARGQRRDLGVSGGGGGGCGSRLRGKGDDDDASKWGPPPVRRPACSPPRHSPLLLSFGTSALDTHTAPNPPTPAPPLHPFTNSPGPPRSLASSLRTGRVARSLVEPTSVNSPDEMRSSRDESTASAPTRCGRRGAASASAAGVCVPACVSTAAGSLPDGEGGPGVARGGTSVGGRGGARRRRLADGDGGTRGDGRSDAAATGWRIGGGKGCASVDSACGHVWGGKEAGTQGQTQAPNTRERRRELFVLVVHDGFATLERGPAIPPPRLGGLWALGFGRAGGRHHTQTKKANPKHTPTKTLTKHQALPRRRCLRLASASPPSSFSASSCCSPPPPRTLASTASHDRPASP